MKVGDIVPADILGGEYASGHAGGLGPSIVLRGVGQRLMAGLYPAEELTELCRHDDRRWAAEVVSLGRHPAPKRAASRRAGRRASALHAALTLCANPWLLR